MVVCVNDCLDDDVLVDVDETLTELFELSIARSLLVHKLNVLPAADLPLFGDSLTILEGANLMIVHVAVVLARLPDESLCALVGLHQKVLLDLEYLLFIAFG